MKGAGYLENALKSDVFAAIAVVVAKNPIILGRSAALNFGFRDIFEVTTTTTTTKISDKSNKIVVSS